MHVHFKISPGLPNEQVIIKLPRVAEDSPGLLREEAEAHLHAWLSLGQHVLSPIGFLEAHGETGTPAMLVLENCM